jgi:hypothetical protein
MTPMSLFLNQALWRTLLFNNLKEQPCVIRLIERMVKAPTYSFFFPFISCFCNITDFHTHFLERNRTWKSILYSVLNVVIYVVIYIFLGMDFVLYNLVVHPPPKSSPTITHKSVVRAAWVLLPASVKYPHLGLLPLLPGDKAAMVSLGSAIGKGSIQVDGNMSVCPCVHVVRCPCV